MSKKKLDLKTKQSIAKKIVKYRLEKKEEPNDNIVEIPEMASNGKPFLITVGQFNKVHDFAQRFM